MKTYLLIPLMALLCGCARPSILTGDTNSVRSKVPVIAEPARPQLEKPTPDELVEYLKLPQSLRAKLEGNNTKLQVWGESLHVAIIEYNGFAKYNNDLSDQSVGVKSPYKK